jgi:predicted hydrolase (HD superfamily)
MNPSRDASFELMHSYITSESLRQHCEMVATAMEGYAQKLEKSNSTVDKWSTAGLLHDLDWEKYPDEHPVKAVNEILPDSGYDEDIIGAVEAHAPDRTGREPSSEIERYLFACDEISGFMNAVSLMRPNGFSDMKVKSVTKKLKDKKFAENVPREDVIKGAELIDLELRDHIQNMISFFKDTY